MSNLNLDNEFDEEGDAPEEVSFQVGKSEILRTKQLLKNELHKAKDHIKDGRRKIHDRNKIQKEEKIARLQELDKKRLPSDLLESVKETSNLLKKVHKKQKVKRLRKKKSKIINDTAKDEKLSVRPVSEIDKQAYGLTQKALEFRNKMLYGSNIHRIPSKDLRKIAEKQEKGGKNTYV